MDAKINEDNLFLAVEQGAKRFENNVNIVINSKMKLKLRKQLVEKYPKLIFKNKRHLETSVDSEEYKI